MRRRPRPFATLTLAALIAALLTACGGPTGTPDPTGPGEGDPEPIWEMLVTGDADPEFTVDGTSVASSSANVIELSASVPGGWSVVFVHDGSLPIGIPYGTDNDDLLSATVTGPAGPTCVVTPDTGGGSFAILTLAEPVNGVPSGIAIVVVREPCAGFEEVSFQMGFGAE